MLDKLLPKFKIVEINNVAALRMGHVIAQTVAYSEHASKPTIKCKEVGDDYKFVENGIIVGLDKENCLANYDATKHSQPCLVYTEELITASPLSGLDQYASLVENKEVYVRALPLNLGDTFTTDNVSGSIADGYAKVVDGVLTMQTSADEDTLFIVKKSNLPAGQLAAECIYCGKVVAAGE